MTDKSKRSYSLYINDDFLIELDMLVLNLRKQGYCRENGEKLRRVDLVYEALDLLKEKYQMSEIRVMTAMSHGWPMMNSYTLPY